MRVIYIAGRFRGATHRDIQMNVLAAEAAGLDVAKLGAMPMIPHKNTENFHGLLTDEFWIDGTAELLRRCDAIYIFNQADLDQSAGTRGELKLAKQLGRPIFFDLNAIEAWLQAEREAA